MLHCLTEQFTQSYGRFGAMILTFRPSIFNGYSCVATINDPELRDLYRDLRHDYPESEDPEGDLQRLIDYVIENGQCYDEEGDICDIWEFCNATGF